ncbi:MAG: DUF3473 domain-containing protein [Patescibacteria group bacterium]|jgi:polysaccharide deacetylase family protein (PEP-CTERM system associated)
MKQLILTFDLEYWFESLSLQPHLNGSETEHLEEFVDQLIAALKSNQATATFFVTGKVIEQEPAMIKKLAVHGHEIAIHSFDHRPLWVKNYQNFDQEIKIMKEKILSLTGKAVLGHRAVNFSLTNDNQNWVIKVLEDNQLRYDSSVFPLKLPRLTSLIFPNSTYGIKKAPRLPYLINKHLYEFPLAVYSGSLLNWPVTGGIYIRITPWKIFKKMLTKKTTQGATTIHFHPFDFLAKPPDISMPIIKKIIKFFNTKNSWKKLIYLLNSYDCQSIEKYLYENTLD